MKLGESFLKMSASSVHINNNSLLVIIFDYFWKKIWKSLTKMCRD